MNLEPVTSKAFGDVMLDIWRNEDGDIFMTSEQLGRALEYSYPVQAIQKLFERNEARLRPNSVVVRLTSTDGKAYDTRVFNEKGVYEIIRWSRQPRANEFYDWAYEVISTIRRTGSYSTQPQYQLPSTYIEALEAHLQSERARIEAERQLALQAPKIALYDVAMQAQNAQPIGTIAKTLNVGPNKLFQFLREHKILISQGAKYNLPYQEYIDRGYFEVRQYTITHFTQGIENKSQTLVTPKGLAYIHRLLEQAKQTAGA